MEAIGLNPIKFDAIGIDPIRMNAIRLGVPGASSGSDRPYIDPEVLSSLVAVVKCDGKTNNDKDRDVVKNLVDPDNPFIAKNFAWKSTSGYGGYVEDYDKWNSSTITFNTDKSKITTIAERINLYYYRASIGRDIESFKVRITNFTKGRFFYQYINSEGRERQMYFTPESIRSNNVVVLPKSWNTLENASGYTEGFMSNEDCNIGITIEQIPLYEGALVTDGIDDFIMSQKKVSEMLNGSTEITVVSMMHQIDINKNIGFGLTNYIRNDNEFIRNHATLPGKTGIYGYSFNGTTASKIDNVLGDKNDYTFAKSITKDLNYNFSVQGWTNGTHFAELSQVAWYWTIIANKVLTTDEINQVIAYYNLDKYVKPTVLYDVKRQGLSNDTPNSDWYLKDYSGNGYDMSLFNFGKAGNSGIGLYSTNFNDWNAIAGVIKTNNKIIITENYKDKYWVCFTYSNQPSYKVKISGIPEGCDLRYGTQVLTNGINELQKLDNVSSATGFIIFNGVTDNVSNLVIEQIPEHAGALCFDGVEDYGKATGLPIYKDYTVVADYNRNSSLHKIYKAIISKSYVKGDGAFIFNSVDIGNQLSAGSFGKNNILTYDDFKRAIRYQSKYINEGEKIDVGNGVDKDIMWIGCLRQNEHYVSMVLYSAMLFPYSLSEFLIERQLKRYKLGTLYPDMIEFRPIIKSNTEFEGIRFRIDKPTWQSPIVGSYYESQTLYIEVKPKGCDEISSIKVNGVEITRGEKQNDGYIRFYTELSKSPQKIDITIDEYVRYEDFEQPYPSVIRFRTEEKELTWGDKVRIGSTIQYITYNSLIRELAYPIGKLMMNGELFDGIEARTIVQRKNKFEWTGGIVWVNKTNIPLAIYSPQKLKIPNESYKYLGYIPDISGHGNHGKINNSAYALNSGVNGYVVDFNSWVKTENVILTDNKIAVIKDKITYQWISYATNGSIVPAFKVNISGIPNGGRLDLFDNNGTIQTLTNGVNDIQGFTANGATGFLIYSGLELDWSNLVIQQIGEYEGAFCLDGVDDFITIPTLSHGGKCVAIKMSYNNTANKASCIYEQRNPERFEPTFCIYAAHQSIAYQEGNNGQTYIDGIPNKHISCTELNNVTHNVVITNSDVTEANSTSPQIGKLKTNNTTYADMRLYDFMLFPEIPGEDEIKKLNEIMGIEGNVWEYLTKFKNSTLISNETLIKND